MEGYDTEPVNSLRWTGNHANWCHPELFWLREKCVFFFLVVVSVKFHLFGDCIIFGYRWYLIVFRFGIHSNQRKIPTLRVEGRDKEQLARAMVERLLRTRAFNSTSSWVNAVQSTLPYASPVVRIRPRRSVLVRSWAFASAKIALNLWSPARTSHVSLGLAPRAARARNKQQVVGWWVTLAGCLAVSKPAREPYRPRRTSEAFRAAQATAMAEAQVPPSVTMTTGFCRFAGKKAKSLEARTRTFQRYELSDLGTCKEQMLFDLQISDQSSIALDLNHSWE